MTTTELAELRAASARVLDGYLNKNCEQYRTAAHRLARAYLAAPPPLRYRIVKPRYRGSMRVGEITGIAVVVRRPKFRTLQAWKDARSLR